MLVHPEPQMLQGKSLLVASGASPDARIVSGLGPDTTLRRSSQPRKKEPFEVNASGTSPDVTISFFYRSGGETGDYVSLEE